MFEEFHEQAETAGKLAEWGEKAAEVAGKEGVAHFFGKVGPGLTVLNAGLDLKEGHYLNTTIDLVSLIPRANPYVFSYETAKQVLYSNFTISGAVNDYYMEQGDLLNKAYIAAKEGQNAESMQYTEEAKVIGKKIADLLATMSSK